MNLIRKATKIFLPMPMTVAVILFSAPAKGSCQEELLQRLLPAANRLNWQTHPTLRDNVLEITTHPPGITRSGIFYGFIDQREGESPALLLLTGIEAGSPFFIVLRVSDILLMRNSFESLTPETRFEFRDHIETMGDLLDFHIAIDELGRAASGNRGRSLLGTSEQHHHRGKFIRFESTSGRQFVYRHDTESPEQRIAISDIDLNTFEIYLDSVSPQTELILKQLRSFKTMHPMEVHLVDGTFLKGLYFDKYLTRKGVYVILTQDGAMPNARKLVSIPSEKINHLRGVVGTHVRLDATISVHNDVVNIRTEDSCVVSTTVGIDPSLGMNADNFLSFFAFHPFFDRLVHKLIYDRLTWLRQGSLIRVTLNTGVEQAGNFIDIEYRGSSPNVLLRTTDGELNSIPIDNMSHLSGPLNFLQAGQIIGMEILGLVSIPEGQWIKLESISGPNGEGNFAISYTSDMQNKKGETRRALISEEDQERHVRIWPSWGQSHQTELLP